MKFTHDENSLMVHILNNYIEEVEQRLSAATEALNEDCLITPYTLETIETDCDLLNIVFDIREKIFKAHPCKKTRELLLKQSKSNRKTLAHTQVFFTSLAFYHSPTNKDEEKNCNECENCNSFPTKSPEHPEAEKMEN